MMRTFAIFIALATLTTALLLAGGASAADGNPCGSRSFSSASASEYVVWRMEVRDDESDYNGPSVHDRLNHNWSDEAKRTYRWTSAVMPVDASTSTQLMAISAAVIAEGVPVLAKGDVVDVDFVQGLDYSRGRAPVILQRVCAARDEGCLDELRRTQEGRVSGVEIKGGDVVAGHRKISPPVANPGCALKKVGCSGKLAAVLQ